MAKRQVTEIPEGLPYQLPVGFFKLPLTAELLPIQNISYLKQFATHFKAKREKCVGTPFPPVPVPLHPWP